MCQECVRTLEKYLLEKALVFMFWKVKSHLSHQFIAGIWEEEQKKINNISQVLIPTFFLHYFHINLS